MSGGDTDAALVAAARSGSDPAFARLVDRYQQPVRLFLRRVCVNAADADDIAQEAFLAAWSKLGSLRQAEQFKSWLFSLAWNKARMAARSAVRARERDTGWQADQAESAEPRSEMAIALNQALQQLPEDQRAAVALCLGGGWSHADAAAILEMPLGTVKSHIARGRERLERILGVNDER